MPSSRVGPVPPAEPSGQPRWLLLSLGVLAAALMLAASEPAAEPGSGTGLTTVTRLDGAAAPTRQPHHLARDELLTYLARVTASVRAMVGAGL